MVRRNKLAVATVSAVAVALLIGLGLSTWMWLEERKAHRQAVLAEQKSQAKEKEARESEAEMRKMLKFFTDTQINRTVLPKDYKAPPTNAANEIHGVVPPGDPRLNGRTYKQWAAAWWKRGLELPMTNSSGAIHPWKTLPSSTSLNLKPRTSGSWCAPFGKIRRNCLIPSRKSLFFQLFGVESSSVEPAPFHGAMADDQAAIARYWADHVVDAFCEIDGIPLSNLAAYRVQSPQISITTPTPWIQGETGGQGTSSGDGYFIFLSPLAPGEHTLHYGGTVRLTKAQDPIDLSEGIDMTYNITVTGAPP